MTKKTRHWLIALSILAFPFVLFFGFLIFMEEPLPPLAPLPNPNGYDDLVKASKMLADNTGSYDEKNTNEMRKVVLANADALMIARAGLSSQCRVPVQFSASFNSNHVSDVAWIKILARAIIAEGQLAEMENRPADAAKSYLDTIHLANEATRGGLLIDELVGMVIENFGTSHLQKLVPKLDVTACRKAAATLETLDAQRSTWSEAMQEESAWSRASFHGWRYNFNRWKERKSTASALAKVKQKFNAQDQKTRQLMIALAARAYELDKGRPPAGVADLVPEYLKTVPQDPMTGTNLIFSR
jgi:hypothetical protein